MKTQAFGFICGVFLLSLAAGCPPADDGQGEGDGGPAFPPTSGLSAEALLGVVGDLAGDAMDGRDEGTAGGLAAQTYITNILEACGIAPALTDGYHQQITTGDGTNILGRIAGTDPAWADRHLIISAHYDHLGNCSGQICNGAYDNAAGVASVLATACAFAQAPTKRSILVALWDAEEPPTFLSSAMGSAYYANNPPFPLEKTDAVLVLDLVGASLWPNFAGHFLMGAEFSDQVKSVVDSLSVPDGLSAYRAGIHLPEQTGFGQQPWSDYDAFRDRKVPFLFITDGQNKRYHQTNDELDGIDGNRLSNETHLLTELVFQLGHLEEAFVWNDNGVDHEADVNAILDVLNVATGAGGLVDGLGLSNASAQALQSDLQKVQQMRTSLDNGASLFGSDVDDLRAATQRIMCLAGPLYSESLCQSL